MEDKGQSTVTEKERDLGRNRLYKDKKITLTSSKKREDTMCIKQEPNAIKRKDSKNKQKTLGKFQYRIHKKKSVEGLGQ